MNVGQVGRIVDSRGGLENLTTEARIDALIGQQ